MKVDLSKERWDHLIILDACRYDYFKELNTIEGKLEKRISCDSDTLNWMIKTWGLGKRFDDIVYISANPIISRYMCKKVLGYIPFHKIVEVWDFGWDEKFKTVPPHHVTQSAILHRKLHRNKRLVIHYIQPHHPYLTKPSIDQVGWKRVYSEIKGLQAPEGKTAYELASMGLITREELVSAYRENLKIVLDEVKKLIDRLEGLIVITADHGEALGENNVYGHPAGLDLPCLVEIPYLRVEKDVG
ncbi:MAG: hypothetical protein DRP27_05340 [Thermotogae bacterium]|nr:MAG: hypothetical protein DRP27_05340 [Thermotogota bacterium]